jgi:hypothetical protein
MLLKQRVAAFTWNFIPHLIHHFVFVLNLAANFFVFNLPAQKNDYRRRSSFVGGREAIHPVACHAAHHRQRRAGGRRSNLA